MLSRKRFIQLLSLTLVFVAMLLVANMFFHFIIAKQLRDMRYNWEALDFAEPGVYLMATPTDPKGMDENFSKYLTQANFTQARSHDFISIILCGQRLVKEIEIKKASLTYILGLKNSIKLDAIFYEPPPNEVVVAAVTASGLTASIPNPIDRTATIFIGKLPSGEYKIDVNIRWRTFYYLDEMESYGDYAKTRTYQLTLNITP